MKEYDLKFINLALEEAKLGLAEKGLPIGAVLVRNNKIVSRGHNQRVQKNNPILHGEMACIANAKRQATYRDTTLYTTLSPCFMCTGTIIQFGIPRVVIGENKNFTGYIEELQKHGIEVTLLNHKPCIEMMANFIAKYPELWAEDIAKN